MNVCKVTAKELFSAVTGDFFNNVNTLATAVVTLRGVQLLRNTRQKLMQLPVFTVVHLNHIAGRQYTKLLHRSNSENKVPGKSKRDRSKKTISLDFLQNTSVL